MPRESAHEMGDEARLCLAREIAGLKPLAGRLFDELREMSRDGAGVTRESYGERETGAAEIMIRAAHEFGLTARFDAGGNLLVTRPADEGARGGVVTGSHLDSVVEGGNFDGAAGVVAGLLVLAALQRAGFATSEPVTLIGTRGEESAWFAIHHIGARAALGLLGSDEIDTARRVDSGRTLAEHMADIGCDLEAVRAGRPTFDVEKLRAYLELHIEQGPVMVHDGVPVGIVSGIRGNVRVRDGHGHGEYAHSGAVPRRMRRDAFLALAEFAQRCEAEWEAIEAEGGDLVLTFGKAYTDPAVHSHNKVPGEVRFVVDGRSHELATLDRVEAFMKRTAAEVAERRGVTLALDKIGRVRPAPMDPAIRAIMGEAVAALDIPAMDIASGGGHDAGDFANRGVPAGMVFVRNPNGSHNPDEAMDLDDFIQATQVLGWTLLSLAA